MATALDSGARGLGAEIPESQECAAATSAGGLYHGKAKAT